MHTSGYVVSIDKAEGRTLNFSKGEGSQLVESMKN